MTKNRRYVCVHGFEIPMTDDHGGILEDENIKIEAGTVWEEDHSKYRFIGGSDSIRLLNEDGRWIEITRETLGGTFVREESE